MKREPGRMAALLRSSVAAESTAKAPVVDAFSARLRAADALAAPELAAPTPRSPRRKKPRRVSTTTKRDSFNLPPEDHALLASLVERAHAAGAWTTKSSVVRAGLHALAGLDDAELRAALAKAFPLKPGRKPTVKPG